jgi:hypothetical protein
MGLHSMVMHLCINMGYIFRTYAEDVIELVKCNLYFRKTYQTTLHNYLGRIMEKGIFRNRLAIAKLFGVAIAVVAAVGGVAGGYYLRLPPPSTSPTPSPTQSP